METTSKTTCLNDYFHSKYLVGLILVWLFSGHGLRAQEPASVTIAGSLQSELGCSGDWQPDCAATHLIFDDTDGVWQKTFDLPAGSWEYKAALNNSWDENYGANAAPNGANIALYLASPKVVKFYYDHATHWITDNVNSLIVTVPGSYQSEIGCPGDWQPDCLRSWLKDSDGDGIYTMEVSGIPPGDYEVKVTIGETWDENYGAGGVPGGANIPFTVSSIIEVLLFEFDPASHVLTITTAPQLVQPGSVTIAGSLQSDLGCSGDWQPDCAATHLTFDDTDGVWQKTFDFPAGSWEYKAALNNSWDENYGVNATLNGANIGLNLASPQAVKFYYDHATHWITDNVNSIIVTTPGSYQSEIGCPGDWQPDCLRSWLKDPDGDGIYTFSTKAIPPGDYETKVAINESWDVNYGQGGILNGANLSFSIIEAGSEVLFSYNGATHILTITINGESSGNQSPVLTADQDVIAVDEGQGAGVTGTVSDPDGDLVTLTASLGTILNHEDGTWSWSFVTTDGPSQSQTVTITGDDGNGGIASASFNLTVNNVPPTILEVDIPMDPVAVSIPVTVLATFSDPAGASDLPYSCSIDYGDGTVAAGTVDEWTCTFPAHAYPSPGVYEIGVTVTDKDGGSAWLVSSRYLTVYDPSGKYVTGGGWILSPPGAYKPDPSVTGMANFGFVSKYKKGSSIPTGNTEFKFNAANLHFKSTSYEWLVVSGSMAQLKGSGTINDEGNFGFLLSAVDGGLKPGSAKDKFRIKIWDKDIDQVLYDNNLESAGDNAVPATTLSGGSIVIYPAKTKSLAESLDNPGPMQPEITIYPNPFTDQLNFEFSAQADSHVVIEIFDRLGRKVKTVFENEVKGMVRYNEKFTGVNMADGIYFYRITIGDNVYNGKVINVK